MMNKLLCLVPLSVAILVSVGMTCFGDGGVDWLITNTVVIIAATIFASHFISFYKKSENAFDLAFAILFFIMATTFVVGVILSNAYFWLFVDIYMITVNVLAAVRFFVISQK